MRSHSGCICRFYPSALLVRKLHFRRRSPYEYINWTLRYDCSGLVEWGLVADSSGLRERLPEGMPIKAVDCAVRADSQGVWFQVVGDGESACVSARYVSRKWNGRFQWQQRGHPTSWVGLNFYWFAPRRGLSGTCRLAFAEWSARLSVLRPAQVLRLPWALHPQRVCFWKNALGLDAVPRR
ncbi:hypothetical protein ROA7450_01078 [Roseovarius albus]|uniref:Uncharacterized protein n=1 Tax=Roseovarius albus TaxID=1247867 RepID=A0A1X6YMW8_9RHOB|nr:hypothetical protein ROA7450_01078 [Roseovarius albus]